MATTAFINIATGAGQVFPNATSAGSVTIATASNSQNIFFGFSNYPVAPLCIGSNFVNVNAATVSSFSNSLNVYGNMNIATSNTSVPLMASTTSTASSTTGLFQAPTLLNVTGNSTGMYIGKNLNNYNSWSVSHVHTGDGSSSNFLGFAPSGYGWNMAITGCNVGIGTSNMSATYALDVAGSMRVNSNAPITPNRPFIFGNFNATTFGTTSLPLTAVQTQGGMTVTSGSNLVAPIAGFYVIGFNSIMSWDSTGARRDIYVLLNGGLMTTTLSENNLSGHHYVGNEIASFLNANDYISFIPGNSGSTYGGTWSTFWFYLL